MFKVNSESTTQYNGAKCGNCKAVIGETTFFIDAGHGNCGPYCSDQCCRESMEYSGPSEADLLEVYGDMSYGMGDD